MGIYADLQREQNKGNETPPEIIIRLEEKRPPTIPIIILGVLTVLFLLFPIGLMLILSSDGFHPKYVFSFALASLPGIFLGRLFLWNRYGEERMKITHEGVHLWNDYRLFQGNKRFLEGRTIYYIYVGVATNNGNQLQENVLDSISESTSQNVQLVLYNAHKNELVPHYSTTVENWEIVLLEAKDPTGRLARLVQGELETESDPV